ncbi:hypothetical protein GCM10009678_93700 [Actinomadura kijaniata]|uniref:Uncharacterized protein n=1 Tax=Actinomadura namibiensis TaxID=182080 RepID=A0A7W3LS52_ACTNM|nr:hypothetical protein [Actinomadura namibiensis]MBA8953259.1 hypothetical protein [Actinomadura namibiensis]
MPGLSPIIGYRDAPAMIDGDGGLIAHAGLTLGAGAVVILGSIRNDTFGLRYTALDPEGRLWGFGGYRPAPPSA